MLVMTPDAMRAVRDGQVRRRGTPPKAEDEKAAPHVEPGLVRLREGATPPTLPNAPHDEGRA